jgi:hypothetical protein
MIVKHQPTGGSAGIGSQVQDAKVGPFSFHAFGGFQEMLG